MVRVELNRVFKCRPISITIMTHKNESAEVERFIHQSDFPSRLRLELYTVGVSSRPDCVYHIVDGSLTCSPEVIYPINRLRNIAIQNSITTHFVVFDMDMWPMSMEFN